MGSGMRKNVHAFVEKLVAKYDTRDPFTIARELGIQIRFLSHYKEIKGYYANILGNKFIIINSSLSETMQRVVVAHELGHAIFHGDIEIGFIRKNTIMNTSQYEHQANEFAAELLINTDDLDPVVLKGKV
jgi:Zn-dependent peptidase ImmA (M78 family)